jgi:hypothetical protein
MTTRQVCVPGPFWTSGRALAFACNGTASRPAGPTAPQMRERDPHATVQMRQGWCHCSCERVILHWAKGRAQSDQRSLKLVDTVSF